jgi:hypothetical protein
MYKEQINDPTLEEAWRQAGEEQRGWMIVNNCLHKERIYKDREY